MENVHTTRFVLFLLFMVQDTFATAKVVNISINKTAVQTDTSGNGTADLAVDGVISGGTCAQTSSALASWEVDLGDYYVIDNILVHQKPDEAPPAAQWVQSVGGFSSEYSSASWSAQKIVGPPNVYPLYGDIVESWSPYYKDSNQFIELEFSTSVYVSRVDIYETFHAGGVKAIKGYQAGQWITMWSTTLIEDLSIARIFSPPLQVTDCFTNMIRLELDLTVANAFVEIDAVQIHGVSRTSTSPSDYIELFTGLSQDLYHKKGYLPSGVAPLNFTMNGETIARWVKITPDVDSILAICEVEVMGYIPTKALFRSFSKYQCAGTPIVTHYAIQSSIRCARLCLLELVPRCHSAQYEKASLQCTLYEGFDTAAGSTGSVMIVHSYAAPLLD